jgi:hypothetical protein
MILAISFGRLSCGPLLGRLLRPFVQELLLPFSGQSYFLRSVRLFLTRQRVSRKKGLVQLDHCGRASHACNNVFLIWKDERDPNSTAAKERKPHGVETIAIGDDNKPLQQNKEEKDRATTTASKTHLVRAQCTVPRGRGKSTTNILSTSTRPH